jgi:hypothetical protein
MMKRTKDACVKLDPLMYGRYLVTNGRAAELKGKTSSKEPAIMWQPGKIYKAYVETHSCWENGYLLGEGEGRRKKKTFLKDAPSHGV